jgi:hypothetical protein
MNRLDPETPYVWPDPRVSEGLAEYANLPPFAPLAARSESVLGVISDLTIAGRNVIADWFESNPTLRARLVIAPYPTGPTGREDLTDLVAMTMEWADRFEARVHPLEHLSDRAGNVICFVAKGGGGVYLVVGPQGDLGCDRSIEGQINLTFRADSILANSFGKSFDRLWARSVPLDADTTARIPFLVVPEGTLDAAEAWQAYLQSCQVPQVESPCVVVDPETGAVTILGEDGKQVASATEQAGLPAMDALTEFVARLYEKGCLVSIDKLSRIPPLDTPIDPAWLGDRAELHRGTVRRSVRTRVSVIEDDTLKEIEKQRTALSKTLPRFSFGLADNMRWIPDAARPLLEGELNQLVSAGKAIIGDLIKGDLTAFLKSRREKLVVDLNEVLAELGHSGKVTEETVDLVMARQRQRLEKAENFDFLPKLSYSRVSFVAREDGFSSPWGQAFSLLADLAAFPRRVICDPYFLRGIEISEDALLDAMDIGEDVVAKERNSRGIRDHCKAGLGFLSRLEKANLDARKRCDLVHGLIVGQSLNELEKTLSNHETESD